MRGRDRKNMRGRDVLLLFLVGFPPAIFVLVFFSFSLWFPGFGERGDAVPREVPLSHVTPAPLRHVEQKKRKKKKKICLCDPRDGLKAIGVGTSEACPEP